MKQILIFIIFQLSFQIGFSQADTLMVSYENNNYFNISNSNNKKLLIYLHGGIRNPYFKKNENISLKYLLEDNLDFINKAEENRFDVIVPITNDNLDWLDKTEFCFEKFKNYINSLNKNYEEIWISGFSDGGTGSYKIFYNNPQYLNGLIVFNGYPYHKNFAKRVNYSKVTSQKVVFFSTKKDKQIPYEFLLTEYSKQKKYNPNTFFYVTEGNHSFTAYKAKDFDLLFKILLEVNNEENKPLHGLLMNDKIIEFYKFRKLIVRKYGFGKESYKENKKQKRWVTKNIVHLADSTKNEDDSNK